MDNIHHKTPDCQNILSYAAGNIIPLYAHDKRPIETQWTSKPSPVNGDASQYLAIGYNLGFRIPEDHLIIDVDPRNGGLVSFASLPQDIQTLPRTTITPSGGFHVYTTLPHDITYQELKTKHDSFRGIDFLHYGKQVVLPGSRLNEELSWVSAAGALLPPPQTPYSLIRLLERRSAPPVADTQDNFASYLTNQELDNLLQTLPVTRYRDNDSWLTLAMACHHATNGDGLPAFLAWSLSDPQYQDQEQIIRARWQSMASDNTPAPVTIRSLVRELSLNSTVPQWLLHRANITVRPDEVFHTLTEQRAAETTYNRIMDRIHKTSDTFALLTDIVHEISRDGTLTEAARELLIKQVSRKTGVSSTAIRRDAKITAQPYADDTQPTNQPHMAAAKTAVLAMSHGDIRPAYVFGDWRTWNGQYWEIDEGDIAANRWALDALTGQGTTVTNSTVSSVVGLMRTLMEVRSSEFTPRHDEITIFTPLNVLRFLGGEWNINEHAPGDKNLTVIGAHYHKDAGEPENWLRFLEQVTTSEHARRTIAVSIIYAAASCRPWLRKAIYLYGPKRSGKSTILNAIQDILGHRNCSALSMPQLSSRFGPSTLIGKLANISNETLSKDVMRDDVFKALISGEAIEVDIKYGPMISLMNSTKMFFGANGFPRIQDETDATTDRLTVISVPTSIPPEEADIHLGGKIRREMTDILKWAMDIFAEEYNKDKCVSIMSMDTAGEEVMDSWRELNTPARRWLRERTEITLIDVLPVDAAYQDYRQWCGDNGHKEANKIHFGRQLGDSVIRGRTSGGRVFVGLKLKKLNSF